MFCAGCNQDVKLKGAIRNYPFLEGGGYIDFKKVGVCPHCMNKTSIAPQTREEQILRLLA